MQDFFSKGRTFLHFPREYLEDVLTRLPGMMASDAVDLTPVNWLRARQGKPLRKAA